MHQISMWKGKGRPSENPRHRKRQNGCVRVCVFNHAGKKVNIETDKMNGRTQLVCSLRSLGNSIPSEILNDELERVTLHTEKYGNV